MSDIMIWIVNVIEFIFLVFCNNFIIFVLMLLFFVIVMMFYLMYRNQFLIIIIFYNVSLEEDKIKWELNYFNNIEG